jgi:hypothetical protein
MSTDERFDDEQPAAEVMDLGMVTRRDQPARDVIEIGGAGSGRFDRRRLLRWLPAVLAVALVAAVLVHHQSSPGAAAVHPTPSSMPAAPAPTPTSTGTATPDPVVTQYFDHPFLGLYTNWELYALGPTNVVRIEFARARLTRTEFPDLQSSGPVSFSVDAAGAVVRPLDRVRGYRVPDAEPARPLEKALADGGPALPGPDGRSFWVPSGGTGDEMMLVDDTGTALGPTIKIPYSMYSTPQPDGAGYLILTDETGSYDARPGGLRRITEGGLIAIGAKQWLVSECDDAHRCSRVLINRQTGARTVVDHRAPVPAPLLGAISPDGHYAAVVDFDQRAHYNVHLLDLTTGRDRSLPVQMDSNAEGSALVWSPDSRWLFAAGEAGELFPIHPDTGAVELLHVPVPPVKQLVIRTDT